MFVVIFGGFFVLVVDLVFFCCVLDCYVVVLVDGLIQVFVFVVYCYYVVDFQYCVVGGYGYYFVFEGVVYVGCIVYYQVMVGCCVVDDVVGFFDCDIIVDYFVGVQVVGDFCVKLWYVQVCFVGIYYCFVGIVQFWVFGQCFGWFEFVEGYGVFYGCNFVEDFVYWCWVVMC